MIVQLAVAASIYFVIGFLVVAGVRKFDRFIIDSGRGDWILFPWPFAFVWPIMTIALLLFESGNYRNEIKHARRRLAKRRIQQAKHKKIESVIVLPENPMDKRKVRFEQVYSNELLTDTDQTKCYICKFGTSYGRLVDTVSTAKVHIECLYEYIEV